MNKLLIVTLVTISTVACNQQKPATTVPTAAPIDQKIAKVSQELAQQCATLATVITLAEIYNTKPEVDKALAAGEAARKAFCANPPSDVNTAIASVADIAIAISTELRMRRNNGYGSDRRS